jgi:2-polyprenyl-6-methoxyphenol hydroxylase-like FAD-dependent oxidoreductase
VRTDTGEELLALRLRYRVVVAADGAWDRTRVESYVEGHPR